MTWAEPSLKDQFFGRFLTGVLYSRLPARRIAQFSKIFGGYGIAAPVGSGAPPGLAEVAALPMCSANTAPPALAGWLGRAGGGRQAAVRPGRRIAVYPGQWKLAT